MRNNDLSFLLGKTDRDIGGRFVVEHFAIAVIAIHSDEHAAAGIGGTQTARFAAETSKHNGVDHTQARACQHGNGQLRDHRHVYGDAISGFETAIIAQQRREFIHSHIELAVSN